MLQTASNSARLIKQSMDRIEAVLLSQFFIRISIGSNTEQESLWKHLLNFSELGGDPVDWKIDNGQFDRSTISVYGSEKIVRINRRDLAVGVTAIALWSRSSSDLFDLHVQGFLFKHHSFVRIITPISSNPKVRHIKYVTISAHTKTEESRIEWRIYSKDENSVEVHVETGGQRTHNWHSSVLLGLLESVSSSIDLTEFRSEQKTKKEIEFQRLHEIQKLETENQNKILRERKLERCIENDLCTSCDAPVIQRRNRTSSELFFGCSSFLTGSCRKTRAITCPKCRKVMIEKTKKTGGTFLGCTNWPKCDGGRNIDPELEMETWLNRQNDSYGYNDDQYPTLDELAREWGWRNWIEFDDSRE